MKGEINVSFLYQDSPFDMKTDNGSSMTLYKTLFLTDDNKLITYYLREKINIELDLPQVSLVTEFKPNAKGKLEMAVTDVKY